MGDALRFRAAARFLAVTAALLFTARTASAFCRSTTCTGDCPRDDLGCKTTGKKLAWPGLCVGVSLQRDGTVNLPLERVRAAVAASFAAWSGLDCAGGAQTTIAFSPLADVSCHRSELNRTGENANIVLFQDTQWRYTSADDTLAKTTVSFDAATGAILDADIELNYAYNEITVGDDHIVYDLQSILTHEVGHFIGLDHSSEPDATMFAAYDVGSIDLRTLSDDDVAAACAAYPADRQGACDPTPLGGLGDACAGDAIAGADAAPGCALSASTGSLSSAPLAWVSLGLLFTARRRRRS